MRRIPLLSITAGLVAGILVYDYVPLNLWFAAAALTVALIIIFLDRIYTAIVYLSVLLGVASCYLSSPRNLDLLYNNPKLTITGEVISVGESRSGQQLTVEIDSVFTNGGSVSYKNTRIILNLFEFETPIKEFDLIRFQADVFSPDNDVELPGDIDYSKYYYYNYIVGSAFIKAGDIQITGEAHSFYSNIKRLNAKAQQALKSTRLSPACADFLDAVLLGNANEISLTQRNIFSEAGLAHILALSGTHVAIISSFVLLLLLPLRLWGRRAAVYVTVAILLWFYAFLTGLSPSVLRAVIMISTVFLAKITSRANSGLNSLCLAAIVILIWSPRSLFSPSFQLSFCAVATILLFGESYRRLKFGNNAARYFSGILFATVSALLGTALLSAYYFHKFPIYTLLANIPAALMLPVIISLGLVVVLFGLAGINLPLLDNLLDGLFTAFDYSARFFADMPHATIDNIYFNGWVFLPYFCFIVFSALYLCYRKTILFRSGLIFLTASIAIFIATSRPPVDRMIYFTGDTRGTEIIIDAGPQSWVVSTRNTPSIETVNRLNHRHADFLGRRSLHTFTPVEKENDADNLIQWHGRLLWIGNKSFMIISSDSDLEYPLPEGHAHYALITRSCPKLNPREVMLKMNIDTVILPKELNARYAKAYQDTLEAYALPYHNLRNKKLWLMVR